MRPGLRSVALLSALPSPLTCAIEMLLLAAVVALLCSATVSDRLAEAIESCADATTSARPCRS